MNRNSVVKKYKLKGVVDNNYYWERLSICFHSHKIYFIRSTDGQLYKMNINDKKDNVEEHRLPVDGTLFRVHKSKLFGSAKKDRILWMYDTNTKTVTRSSDGLKVK